MAESIRLKVWLLGLLPIVGVVGLVAAFVIASGKTAEPRKSVAVVEPSSTEPASIERPAEVTAPASAPASPPSGAPRAVPVMAPYVPAASSALLRGPPPEPIPELDGLSRPKGSEQWSAEEKQAYREKVLGQLDAKERSLEREIAAARSAGDAATFKEKNDTLAYLRAKRGLVEQMVRRHDAMQDGGS